MELTTLRNIGTEMKRKLNTIGINGAEDLIEMGSKKAFFRLKVEYPEICLVHLYVLQGAIDNVDYNMLSPECRAELREFYEWY